MSMSTELAAPRLGAWARRCLGTMFVVPLAMLSPSFASAQHGSLKYGVDVGDRIRVSIDNALFIGSVRTIRGDTVFIVARQDTARVIMSAVQRVEISLGKSRLSSGGYGAILGGALGGLGGYLVLRDVGDFLRLPSDSFRTSAASLTPAGRTGLTVGAVFGGAAGFAIGALTAPERWKFVPSIGGLEAHLHAGGVQFRIPLRVFQGSR